MKNLKPKKIQDIFNIVISNKLYFSDRLGSEYMCLALVDAHERKLITYADFRYAKKCINDFFAHQNFNSAPLYPNLCNCFGIARLALANKEADEIIKKYQMQIYKRWSHRNVLINKLKAKNENI